MIPLLWLFAALAGPRHELAAALGEGAEAALACSEALPAPPWDEAARWIADRAPLGGDPEEARRRLRDWLDGAVAAGSGLAFRAWGDGAGHEFRFRTELDAEDLARAFARVYTRERAPVVPEARGWQVQLADGRDLHVEVAEGQARARMGAAPAGGAGAEPSAVLASLPDTRGCAAWARWRDEDDELTEVAAHLVPGDALDLHFAVSGSWAKRVEGVAFLPGRVPAVRTPQAPEAVLVVGLGLDSVNFSRFLAGKALRQARWLQSHLPVTGGTTVAVVPGEDGPRFGAAVPLGGRVRDATVARRLRRVLSRLDVGLVYTPNGDLVVLSDGELFHVGVDQGRILVASDLLLLQQMREGVGPDWVDPETLALAHDYPLVLSTRVVPAPGGMPRVARLEQPASLAVTVEGRVLRGALAAPVSLPELRRWLDEARRLRDRLGADPTEPGS